VKYFYPFFVVCKKAVLFFNVPVAFVVVLIHTYVNEAKSEMCRKYNKVQGRK